MTQNVMMRLTAAPVIKPWGLAHADALSSTGIRVGLGELWLASAQTGPGNYASEIAEPEIDADMAEVLLAASEKGGEDLRRILGEQPIQTLNENPHRGKTEAWHVRCAEGRAGFAAGPRTAEQCRELEELITGPGLSPNIEEWPPEVRELFGLIEPVQSGEVYQVPAGTLHTMFAIGDDSRLIIDEIQQGYGASRLPTLSKILMVQGSLLSVQVHPSDETMRQVAEGEKQIDQDLESNPTVRVYDFGRRPGEYPELGFELTDPSAGLKRVTPVDVQLDEGVELRVMVVCEYFVKIRLKMSAGKRMKWQPRFGSYRVIHCIAGDATLASGSQRCQLNRGETVFVPGALEEHLEVETTEGCELFDDAVPCVMGLRDFLLRHGATEDELESLFNPPRAL